MDKRAAQLAILEKALPNVVFDGWSNALLEQAAIHAGYAASDVVRVFPHGVMDALNLWLAHADEVMQQQAALKPLASMKIRERIAALVMLRLDYFLPHREAIRAAMGVYTLPWNSPAALQTMARTVDIMWRLAGDTATDYNWYTKRALLSGVYSSTLLVWLNDESEGQAHTREFLKRRIENVLQIEKFKKRITGS